VNKTERNKKMKNWKQQDIREAIRCGNIEVAYNMARAYRGPNAVQVHNAVQALLLAKRNALDALSSVPHINQH
jgi:hypothetical protein